MKKKLFAIALAVICLSVATYGTLAYFTADEDVVNVVTAGSVDITVRETATPSDGGDSAPFEDVIGVMPGTEVSKIVQVENTGNNGAYIRISLEKAIALAEEVSGEPDLSLVKLNLNTENWTEKDGYYYYNTPLVAGEITEPLFTTVTFDENMGNLYQNSKASIFIHAEAVQTDNNGANVFEAAGWPVTE